MDTLAIVRKIREAEALADVGNYADARKTLELMLPLELSGAHRQLITKKLQLFEKQQTRRTGRIQAADKGASNAATVVRKPRAEVDQPTAPVAEIPAGIPTEVVPKLNDTQGARLQDSQELAPVPDRLDEDTLPPRGVSVGGRHASSSLRRKPTSELQELAEKLPEGDMRRELANEILKLRNEVDRFRTDRISRMVKALPSSGDTDKVETRISQPPASSAHIPGRDEEAEDLRVLRRDTVRSTSLPVVGGSSRISIREAIESDQVVRPTNYRPYLIGALAAVGGILVVWLLISLLQAAFSGSA
jgi:hypothetical protein